MDHRVEPGGDGLGTDTTTVSLPDLIRQSTASGIAQAAPWTTGSGPVVTE